VCALAPGERGAGDVPLDEEGNPIKVSNYIPSERTVDEISKVERISTGINFDKYDKIKVDVSKGDKDYTPVE